MIGFFKRNRLSGCAFLLSIFLAGCSEKSPPLPGKRMALFSNEEGGPIKNKAFHPDWSTQRMRGYWPQADVLATHDMGLLDLPNLLKELWTQEPGTGSEAILSGPIVTCDGIFTFNSDGCVYALKLDGSLLWAQSIDTEKTAFGGGCSSDGNGRLYVSCLRHLACLDQKNGKILWKTSLGAPCLNAPLVYKGYVICLTMMNQTEVFDAQKGHPVWEHTGLLAESSLRGSCVPCAYDNILICAYSSGEVVALSLQNGEVLWSQSGAPVNPMDGHCQVAHIRANPIIHDRKVYIISYNSQISCFDLESGNLFWKQTIGGMHTPVIVKNILYMVSDQNSLVALCIQTGEILWRFDLPKCSEKKNSWAGPIAAGNFLYLGSTDGQLIAVDPRQNRIVHKYAVNFEVILPPIVSYGVLYLIGKNGQISAFGGIKK